MTNPNTKSCPQCGKNFDPEIQGRQYYCLAFCCEGCFRDWLEYLGEPECEEEFSAIAFFD